MQRTARIVMRTWPEFKARWKKQAAREGLDLTAWIEKLANGACPPDEPKLEFVPMKEEDA